MSTFTQILYQIVYSTKNRDKTLDKSGREQIFMAWAGLLKKKRCHLYQIGGVVDHVHIITALHPTIALASLVKDLKLAADKLVDEKKLFSHFNGWQEGYAAFTYSIDAKDNLIRYAMNQEVHHRQISFEDELRELLREHKIEFDEKYLL